MPRERIPARNILALSRPRDDLGSNVAEAATSYMPTNVDLAALMPNDLSQGDQTNALPPESRTLSKHRRGERSAPEERVPVAGAAVKRKRISLYLDDEVLTKIFRVSLERHEQLSAATHRLIIEALKARGM